MMQPGSTHIEDTESKENSRVVLKLIYFWAFIEAGLGGFLHLLHIPLTGFIVGGFAVIIIVLLAKFGNNHAAVFLKALGIVLAVKFLISPYTPFGAYIAVSFQGLLAIVLFSVSGLNRITVFLFATIVMIESGIQKPVMAYLVFGKDFLNATMMFIADTFSTSKEIIAKGTLFFLSAYLLLYFIWGVVLSHWSNNLLKNIRHLQTDKISDIGIQEHLSSPQQTNNRVNKRYWTIISTAVLILLISIPFLTGNLSGFYLLRIVLMLSIVFLIAPLLIRKHQFSLLLKNKETVNDIVISMPGIRSNTLAAWKMADGHRGLKKMYNFITYAIWLNVFYEQQQKA